MEKEQVVAKIKSATKDGRISCSEALGIARDMGVSPKEVGDLLNDMKIKIHSCQLGCFP
jgi:LAO/AO transport system kinase